MSRLPAGLLALAVWSAGAGLVAQERVDRHGDPLPAGAIARLGTTRLRHGGMITALAVAPDGRWLAAAARGDSTVHVWDTATGKELRRFGSFEQEIAALAIAPDAKTLAVGVAARNLRLYDANGREFAQTDRLPGRAVRIEFAAGRLAVATAAPIKPLIQLRDVNKPQDVLFTTPGTSFALSRDGKTMLVGGVTDKDPWLQVVDVASGKKRDLPAPKGEPDFLALTPDAKRFVMQDGPDQLSLREVGDGSVVRRFPSPAGVSILAAALSDDGKTLVTSLGSYLANEPDRNQRTTIVWDVETAKPTQIQVPGRGLGQIGLSRDGKLLALGGEDATLHLFELPSGRSPHQLDSHISVVTTLAFAPDGRTLVTGGDDGTIRLWEVPSGKQTRVVRGHANAIACVAYSSDGLLATAGGLDHTFRLWEAATGRHRHVARMGDSIAWAIEFAPDGKSLAVAIEGHPLQVLDVAAPADKYRASGPNLPAAVCLAFSPDGKLIAVPGLGEEDERPAVRLVHADNGEVARAFSGQPRLMTNVAFSADGRLLAACGGDVRIWELASGTELLRLDKTDRQRGGVAFSPDGRLFAEGSSDGSVGIYEVGSFIEVKRLPAAAPGIVPPAVAFSPDGKLLATTCHNTVLLWDVSGIHRSAGRALTKAELDTAWTDLASVDGPKAVAAVAALIGDPDKSVPFLRERLAAVAFPKAEHLSKLITDLGDAKFATRQSATRELMRLGRWAEPALRLATMTDVEPQRRRAELLKSFSDPSRATEVLRVNRAIWALEQSGTPAAGSALKELANRVGVLTDAPAAVKRLETADKSPRR